MFYPLATSIRFFYLFVAILLALASPTMSLKNAVVTGANRGLGLEICKQLCLDERYEKIYALCRQTSQGLTALADNNSQINVVDGVDVMKDETGAQLASYFRTDSAAPVPIHLLLHNAGAYGPPEEFENVQELYNSQTLLNITPDRMRHALELNTIAPLFITQALIKNLQQAANDNDDNGESKVVIISSLMGSMTDNTSGSHYGYRTAKAAVNMVGKGLAMDLKKDKIAVGMVHPGFVFTGFDKGTEPREGQRAADESVKGVLQAVDQVTLESTGCFLHGGYGEGVTPLSW